MSNGKVEAKMTRYKMLVIGVCVGGALLAIDVVATLFRSYPVFFQENHRWGTIGFLIVAAFGGVWLWDWSKTRDSLRPARSDFQWMPDPHDSIGDAQLGGHALQWVNAQIDYYQAHGQKHGKLYWGFKAPSLVAMSLVPIFALQMSENFSVLTAGLGALVAISEGFIQVGRYRDNWVMGLSTRDGLERERELFLTESGPYSNNPDLKKRVVLFAERSSALMMQEETEWAKIRRTAEASKNR